MPPSRKPDLPHTPPKPPGKRQKPPAGSSTASSSPLTNLEMKGDRLKVFSLQTLLTNKRNPETRPVARLGDVLLPWFEKTITKPAEKLAGISDLWQQHVPEKLLSRSRLVSYVKGTLTVSLDSAAVRAELDSHLRAGLLRTLQLESKGALYRVKTTVDSAQPNDK